MKTFKLADSPITLPIPRPCPFCGEVPDALGQDQGDKWGHVRCCISGPEVRTLYLNPWEQPHDHFPELPLNTHPWAHDAITQWNHRVPMRPGTAADWLYTEGYIDEVVHGHVHRKISERK